MNLEIFTSLLSPFGMRVTAVANGPDALTALARGKADGDPFSLAVLDMQMPGMDGISLSRAIKAAPELRGTKLVLCSSMGQSGKDRCWTENGFIASLNKPIHRQELRAVLEAALGSGGEASGPVSAAASRGGGARLKLLQARILVADDNATNQQVAQGILTKLGQRVDVVGNGLEALRALESIPYDLVLMDVQMPEMDGIEATLKVRDPHTPVLNHRVPILAMTAHAMQGDRDKCLAAGMDGYLTKPIEVAALVTALEMWLPAKVEERHSKTAVTGETGAAVPLAAKVMVFDRAALLERVLDDEDLMQVVIEAFLGDLPGQITALQKAVEMGDTRRVEQCAHQIKGASATVGGNALSALAGTLEQAGKAGDLALISERVREVGSEFVALKEALDQVLATHKPTHRKS